MYNQAIKQLQAACTPKGILASTIKQDNYQRIWSRDGVMAGLAGLISGDDIITDGLRYTCLTLAKNQLPKGTIASNVPLDDSEKSSYGSIAGRVDATSWFVIGSCLYYINTYDENFWEEVHPAVVKALAVMDAWEFNDKHLIYTPLSGNWADEYPMHGYLLYDNLLRYWAVKLCHKIDNTLVANDKIEAIKNQISNNFLPNADMDIKEVYHKGLYQKVNTNKYQFALAGFNPARYYEIFDACANGLAMMLGFDFNINYKEYIKDYNQQLFADIGSPLIPAFWPPIKPEDELWNDIKENYAYDFKNHPYQFHNGGIWPIMMGWYSLGLSSIGLGEDATKIHDTYAQLAANEGYQFSEYFDGKTIQPKGKKPLSYSATGGIFMKAAQSQNFKTILSL